VPKSTPMTKAVWVYPSFVLLGDYLVNNTRISSIDKSYHDEVDYAVKKLTT
jgi:hypothetical protein